MFRCELADTNLIRDFRIIILLPGDRSSSLPPSHSPSSDLPSDLPSTFHCLFSLPIHSDWEIRPLLTYLVPLLFVHVEKLSASLNFPCSLAALIDERPLLSEKVQLFISISPLFLSAIWAVRLLIGESFWNYRGISWSEKPRDQAKVRGGCELSFMISEEIFRWFEKSHLLHLPFE